MFCCALAQYQDTHYEKQLHSNVRFNFDLNDIFVLRRTPLDDSMYIIVVAKLFFFEKKKEKK